MIVRVYAIEGREAEVDVRLFVPPAKAELVNMFKEEGRPLSVLNGAVRLKVGHHGIETVKIHLMKSGT